MAETMATAPAAPLALVFELNNGSIARAIEGLSEEQLEKRLSDCNNSMLWILAHLTHVRAGMLRLLGKPVDTGWGALFARGAAVRDDVTYPSSDEVLRVHQKVAAAVADTLASLTPEQLAAPAVNSPIPLAKTVGEQVGFFTMHDSYHVGQLSYIRKGFGLPGVAG